LRSLPIQAAAGHGWSFWRNRPYRGPCAAQPGALAGDLGWLGRGQQEPAFEDAAFDKVFGVYTLKYSADLETAISEMARVLKPGGRFVSYEILVSDSYDAEDKQHRYLVDSISHSTCMPPLWPAQAVRDAAQRAGLTLREEKDLCAGPKEGAWYSCFERTGIHALLSSPLLLRLVEPLQRVHAGVGAGAPVPGRLTLPWRE